MVERWQYEIGRPERVRDEYLGRASYLGLEYFVIEYMHKEIILVKPLCIAGGVKSCVRYTNQVYKITIYREKFNMAKISICARILTRLCLWHNPLSKYERKCGNEKISSFNDVHCTIYFTAQRVTKSTACIEHIA